MIIKGKARSGPAQLAAYLMRSDEHATILDPGIDEDDLHRDFMIWDVAGEGTRGEKTLYHCQIAPDPRYKLTPEQYLRSAQILAEDLGMANHPRRVVLHDGGGRPHLHVVFQRTDLDKMTLWDDSFNYVKHERASKRMALEFGHEIVPGKHAKRDRQKQPEFPRQDFSPDEAQRAKRTGKDLKKMKAELAALKAGSDSAPAFKAAVEDAGFILANGDRGYTLVDDRGEPYNLARQLKLKTGEVNKYMAAVSLDNLPTVEQAQELQTERRKTVSKSNVAKSDGQPEPEKQPEEKGVEASKFLPPQTTQQQPQPIQAPEDAELEALKKALAERQAKEVQKWADYHALELRRAEFDQEILYKSKTADFDAMQQQERDRLKSRHAEQRTGIKGIIDAIQNRWNPTLGAEKAKERRREIAQLKRRQEKERKDYLALLEQSRQLEIENLKERQALRNHDEELKRAKEQERYIREHHEAKHLREEIEAQRIQDELDRNDSLRDGPPPPKLGK